MKATMVPTSVRLFKSSQLPTVKIPMVPNWCSKFIRKFMLNFRRYISIFNRNTLPTRPR